MLSKPSSSNPNYSFVSADFEAHGNTKSYSDSTQVSWVEGTHAQISIGLNGHGIWNEMDVDVGNPVWDVYVDGSVGIGDFFEDAQNAQWWYPWKQSSEFKLLGLDKDGKPIGDQIWAAFRGRLGDSYSTGLDGAVYFDNSGLNAWDWAFVKLTWAAGSLFGKIPSTLLWADGPLGPGGRDWVTPLKVESHSKI